MILGVFATVIPAFLMTDGIKKIGVRNTSITATLGPVWTIVLAAIVLGEEINFVQIIGTVFVVGGVLIATLQKK
jgi:drug/metabolite transporter (DMT)-like permease